MIDWNELQALFQFGLTAFVTLLVVVDPFGATPILVGLTGSMTRDERRSLVTRAVAIAFGVAIFFMIAGSAVLAYMGVTVNAFSISGGILLFATALPMLFGERPRLQAPEPDEQSTTGDTLAVFPLAIPLLSGPGAIATILLLANRASTQPGYLIMLVLAIALVYAIAWLTLRASDRIIGRLGPGRVHIITRVLGILLAALAVQFVLNGVAGYYKTLVAP